MNLTAAVRLAVDSDVRKLRAPEVFSRSRDPAWRRSGRLGASWKGGEESRLLLRRGADKGGPLLVFHSGEERER
jgi:hypothetical protein